ncbi:MAG: hypothetical protein AB4050_11290 [Synechococcus sp.]
MTYQLVNILEYIIPEVVEAEIHRHKWDSQLDELVKQHIVLKLLNRISPCYQLLTSEQFVCESRSPTTSFGEHLGTATFDAEIAPMPHAKTACLQAVETMLPKHVLQQLQTAVETEISGHVTSKLAH